MASHKPDLGGYDISLYHMHLARSTRVKWLLHEVDAADKVKIENMNLLKGDQRKPEFVSINRMGGLPTLTIKEKDGDTSMVMTESGGICMWLADIVGDGSLKPDSGNVFGLGQYYRFIAFAACTMDGALWDIRLHEELYPEHMRVTHVAKVARQTFLNKIVPTLEDVLKSEEGVEFICEPFHKGFTAADIMVGYALFWATKYGLLDNSKTLRSYLGRLKRRKGFLAATGAGTEDRASL